MNTVLIKRGAHLYHSWISRSKLLSYLYVTTLGRIVRLFPNAKIKKQIRNSLNAVTWNDCDLPAQSVCLGQKEIVKIVPHFCEFDFEVLLSSNIDYESEVFQAIEFYVEKADVVLEIGANVGIYSLFFASVFSRLNKAGNIFVFEPSQKAYMRLLKNIELNKFKNIQPFNIAVSDRVGVTTFFEPDGHLTNGSLKADFAHHFSSTVESRKTLTIDGEILGRLVEGHANILMKIDVEGAEYEVLKGLNHFINKAKPTIFVEVLAEYEEQLNQLDFINDNGYSLWNITPEGNRQRERFIATDYRDYVLLPPI